MTVPVAPQARAVPTASVTRLAAPRLEAAFPPRSRAAVITGADSGVLTVAVSAFSPRTSSDFPWIFAWRGYLVLIGSSQDNLAREREVMSAFCSRQVDGLIVVPCTSSHRFLAEQIERGTKVVCVDRPAAGLAVDTVLVDNRPASHHAVSRLLARGHWRIG